MTPRRLNLPDNASVSRNGPDARQYAPSAQRNIAAILDVCRDILPPAGRALEIASGTGEHIIALGRAHPALSWQPSDADPDRLSSISAWLDHMGSDNVKQPVLLDATTPGWGCGHAGQDAIILTNLCHLISAPETRILVSQIALALAVDGVSLIYGPFRRGTAFASNGDKAFHKSLARQDPQIGYKSYQQMQDWQRSAGLLPQAPIEMPANNLMLVARKPPAR
jgi:Protein of unknown function (DUF938)